jgi:hypothetical protein
MACRPRSDILITTQSSTRHADMRTDACLIAVTLGSATSHIITLASDLLAMTLQGSIAAW